jgi:drug/metabolite transporter (DMT)-like permease
MFARIRWQLALLSITVVWGGTFVVVQDAVERIPPFTYLTLRFGLAVLVMALAGGFAGLRRSDLVPGGLAGLALLAGYGFQTTGLQYTTPSNAGFITGMFLVFTPLFVAASYRKLPPTSSLAGVAVATVGLFLLAAPGRLVLSYGDTLVLVCAAAFAAHIMALDRWGEAMPTKRFASLQLTVVTLGAGAIALGAERGEPMAFDASVWGAIAPAPSVTTVSCRLAKRFVRIGLLRSVSSAARTPSRSDRDHLDQRAGLRRVVRLPRRRSPRRSRIGWCRPHLPGHRVGRADTHGPPGLQRSANLSSLSRTVPAQQFAKAAIALSMPSVSTSRCVTARMRPPGIEATLMP